MITYSSRYRGWPLSLDKDAQGNVRISVMRLGRSVQPTTSRVHIWRDSDRIDQIASQYLGNPNRWWSILDINPSIADPHGITPGTQLRIPDA
jgi:hypothetical protein